MTSLIACILLTDSTFWCVDHLECSTLCVDFLSRRTWFEQSSTRLRGWFLGCFDRHQALFCHLWQSSCLSRVTSFFMVLLSNVFNTVVGLWIFIDTLLITTPISDDLSQINFEIRLVYLVSLRFLLRAQVSCCGSRCDPAAAHPGGDGQFVIVFARSSGSSLVVLLIRVVSRLHHLLLVARVTILTASSIFRQAMCHTVIITGISYLL